jgi:small subunit ribosomal protein S3e
MESGAKGCEVVVSGKLRGQRAKSMKFVDGLMIHSGESTNEYVSTATRHVQLRQGMFGNKLMIKTGFNLIYYFLVGILGIKVKIMLPYDSNGKTGPKKPLPDSVSILEPKDEVLPSQPTSEVKASKDLPQPVPIAM